MAIEFAAAGNRSGSDDVAERIPCMLPHGVSSVVAGHMQLDAIDE